MIQLMPVKDRGVLDKLNSLYHKAAGFAYVCIERSEITDCCLYSIEDGTAEVHFVSAKEKDLFDGLVRAVFACLIDMGIGKAHFDAGIDREMLELLHFVKDGSMTAEPLQEILQKCGHCKI